MSPRLIDSDFIGQLTSLKALWPQIKDQPETDLLRQWFWYRVVELNRAELYARLAQKGEKDGESK